MNTGDVSARLALVLVVLATLGLGLSVGTGLVAGAVAGALALAWGLSALQAERNSTLAVGSVAVVFGSLSIVAASALVPSPAARAVVVSGSLAVLFSGLVAAGDPAADWLAAARGVFTLGMAASVLLAVVAAIGHVLLKSRVAQISLVGQVEQVYTVGSALLFGYPLLALVTLQVLVILSAFLYVVSRRVVRDWLGGSPTGPSWEAVESVTFDVRQIPNGYWLLFGLQTILLAVPDGGGLLEWVLSSLWVFGDAVRIILLSGVLHVPLAAFVLFMGLVAIVEGLHPFVTAAFGSHPGRRLAVMAGGLVAATAVVVGSALRHVWLGKPLPRLLAGYETGFGAGAAVSGTLLLVFLGFLVALWVVRWFLRSFVHDRNAVRLAGFGLFTAAIATELAGGPPVAVFAGVATALVAWDLGTTAADVSSHLGEYAESRRAEVVHSSGTVAVGIVAVLLASAAIYLVGPVSVPAERAGTAVLLALVGALGLLAYLTWDGTDEE